MVRFIVGLLLFFIGNIGAQAQSGWEYLDNSPERLIGLLDLPDVVRDGCGPAPARATTRAFSTPSQSATPVGMIYWREEADSCGLMFERTGGGKETIPTLESGYEIPAAIVYERRGSWFRIRLANGSAWVRRGNAEDFLSYPDMLRERLAYTLQGWDGRLLQTPGTGGKVTSLTPAWKTLLDRQLSVEYLGSRRVGNELWIQIRLAAKAACDQIYEGATDISGWIPAYRPNRSPSVWFSSRGC